MKDSASVLLTARPMLLRRPRGGGMTLIELVLVIVLIGVLSAAVFLPIVTGVKMWNQIQFREEPVAAGRAAFDRMMRDMRPMVHCRIYAMGGYRLLFNAQYFQEVGGPAFYGGDIFEHRPEKQALFYYYGFTYYGPYNANPPPDFDAMSPFVAQVSNFLFEYFDMWGTPISGGNNGVPNPEIWRIRMTATINDGGNTVTLQEEVYPRNFLRENKWPQDEYNSRVDVNNDPDCP